MFSFRFFIQFTGALAFCFTLYSVESSELCKNSFKQSELNLELKHLQPLPLKLDDIIQRVQSGEDLRIIGVHVLEQNYQKLKAAFPKFKIYTAVKAVAVEGMLNLLKKSDSHFETASIEEIDQLIHLGVEPQRILFSHPDKDALEISKAYEHGVRSFVSDSIEDLQLIAKLAPRSEVLIRIIPNEDISNVKNELTQKIFDERFGLDKKMTKKLILKAKKLGLKPKGLAFHVGTQAEKMELWEQPIKIASSVFNEMKKENIILDTLNMGGGFPSEVKEDLPSLSKYETAISGYIKKYFKDSPPTNIIIEPGRSLSGTAGVTISRVINVKKRNKNLIVTVSAGRFSAGLVGYGQKAYFYSKENNYNKLEGPYVSGAVYGKVAASLDKIHEEEQISLPKNLKAGDIVVFRGTGAYTGEMSCNGWCGKLSPTDIFSKKHFQGRSAPVYSPKLKPPIVLTKK